LAEEECGPPDNTCSIGIYIHYNTIYKDEKKGGNKRKRIRATLLVFVIQGRELFMVITAQGPAS
jgi:hypothetical protein